MTRLLQIVALILTLISLQACQYYGVHFTQGNILTSKKINKLHVGMSQEEVLRVLGTPVYENTFNTRRWVYVYTTQIRRERTKQKVILTFDHGRIANIER